MMKHEFEELAGYKVSDEDYNKIIEPMYMSINLTKQEFVKVIDRKRFEVKEVKSESRIRLEQDINNRIEEYKEDLKYWQNKLEMYDEFYKEDNSQMWMDEMKFCKDRIRNAKAKIKELKWVLGL